MKTRIASCTASSLHPALHFCNLDPVFLGGLLRKPQIPSPTSKRFQSGSRFTNAACGQVGRGHKAACMYDRAAGDRWIKWPDQICLMMDCMDERHRIMHFHLQALPYTEKTATNLASFNPDAPYGTAANNSNDVSLDHKALDSSSS
eukprot:1161293-Pelagomonas_calceolata.AAC.7